MAQSTFDGPIRSLGGIFQQGAGSVITITASATLNPTDHGGRILAVGGSLAANVVLTLPTINTTASSASAGPGYDPNTPNNLGVTYTIWVPTTISTSSLKIGTDGTDKYVGYVLSIDSDTTDATRGFGAAATNDFINFNGSTTGGIAGTWVQIVALAALKYMVTGVAVGSGTVATPFADS
jgi:hypothetical protein